MASGGVPSATRSLLGGSVISSPGIRAGTILIPEYQYQSYSPNTQQLFERVFTGRTFMYRYKEATEQFVPSPIAVPESSGDVVDEMWCCAIHIHNAFLEVLSNPNNAMGVLIDADDDEEFTYDIFITVLNLLSFKEEDWMLQHEFGTMYSVHAVEMILDNE